MKKRYSPRINITLPPHVIEGVAKYQKEYGWKRSSIIRLALVDWLKKQPPIKEPVKKQEGMVAGQPFDIKKKPTDYVTSDMSLEELDKVFAEYYEAYEDYEYKIASSKTYTNN